MFIETLEFTIPVDLCDLFSSMKRGPQSNLEFPASVNSYGTTQDANIQVVLKSNKLTFKVDGVSSNSSMISKSECKTLKLSVFDVDTSLPESDSLTEQSVHQSPSFINPAKRPSDRPIQSRPPPAKASRPSYSNSSPKSQNIPSSSSVKEESEQINIKQEPDLIEIEPDPDPYEDNSAHSDMQMSQAALDRLSHPRSSNSSSSSFHHNVPHVQDYSEPGPSHQGEDYVVYQDTGDNDYDDNNDSSADFGNDHDGAFVCEECGKSYRLKTSYYQHVKRYHRDPAFYCRYCKKKFYSKYDLNRHEVIHTGIKAFRCELCGAQFYTVSTMKIHIKRIHVTSFHYYCKHCGKGFNDRCLLWEHENRHSTEIGSGEVTPNEQGELTPGDSEEITPGVSGDLSFGDPGDITAGGAKDVLRNFKQEDSDD